MRNLPKDSRSQEIGRLAARALGGKLPKSWIETPLAGDTDFGIDYTIQLKSTEDYVNYSFYLQLKGTTVPSYNTDKEFISHDFDVSTLNNYYQQEPLVMVAIVDLSENEDNLSDCPIYYFWLEEEWFVVNKDKLETQKTIAVRIPTTNILTPSLNIYDYYSNRISEKFAVAELKKKIQIPNKTSLESIEIFTNAIVDKPLILKSIEKQSEAPWIDNPKGEVSTDLKNCSDCLSNNRINDAKEILNKLDHKKCLFSEHELAEFYYQKGNIMSCEGFFDDAETYFELAYKKNFKNRYRLAYLESKFKLDCMPSHVELEKLIEVLDESDFHECSLKAKSLSIIGRSSEALSILKKSHPNEIMMQMVVCTIGELYDDLDKLIEQNIVSEFDDERKKYIFNSLIARRYFHKSTNQVGVHGEVLPFHGHPEYDVEGMKLSLTFMQRAWGSARKLGYPSDVTMLIDISCLVYGYFNKSSELCFYLEEILVERPNHVEIIRQYIRLLFNSKEYKKTIEWLGKLGTFDVDECGIHLLSFYYSGKSNQFLDLIQKYESTLLGNVRDNTALIFCIGIEIAEATFQKALVERYENIIKSLPNGEAFISIQKFVSQSNLDKTRGNEFVQELYQAYMKLGKPLVIAEQLLKYLNPQDSLTAPQYVELAEHVLSVSELSKNRSLDLAQAFFTTERWENAEKLAEKNIAKGVSVCRWKLVQSISLKNQGKVGVAYSIIKDVIKSEDIDNSEGVGKKEQDFFISLSLSLGFIDNVVDFLEENLINSTSIEDKILITRQLIAVYLNRPKYELKLKTAILKYGYLINQNNCSQEGDYLHLCMLYNPFENDDQISNYHERCNKYFENFPDSEVLRRANINIEGNGEALLASLRELTGVTPEHEKLWESNKQKLRSKVLPIPFSMRGNFLQNTRDVYTTWILSKYSKDEELEFKILHAPQEEEDKFFELIHSSNIILLEETTLLILNDLNLLDSFLKALPKFSILESVFKKINLTTHEPVSVNSQISGDILKVIQNNIEKLQLIHDEEKEFKYDCDLNDESVLLLTDDLYLTWLVKQKNLDVAFGNIFNILEFLHAKDTLSEQEFHKIIGDFFELGIIDINFRYDFLGELINYHLGKPDVDNYEDTGFKYIFDKILVQRSNFRDKQKLFLDMFSWVDISDLSPNTLISLIRKLLEDHPMFDPQKVVNTWFVYCGLQREILKDADTSVSKIHEDLWMKYKQVIEVLNNTKYSSEILLRHIIGVIGSLDENICEIALNNLKASFSPDTNEYKYLETII
ncbi:DUF4365 domain-containing protein [Acinetobacter sp. ANC 4910]|uniref:DUF4365 domain-containing protein n=1 Tax=Acinetobacter sp. ANC 4910 TaxID=2529850 RepID=UPI001038EFDB|nr:DUF4365 domain-containing protein [Acinetobacter sp. ANC 4910]TCB38225.1 DUF4365 domain-containing protein [Acinetobacter sp. ANC 4910]